jgi:hypothetical protein
MLEANDILLILGKGHENYQIIGTEKIHLDDAEEVRNFISYKNSVTVQLEDKYATIFLNVEKQAKVVNK